MESGHSAQTFSITTVKRTKREATMKPSRSAVLGFWVPTNEWIGGMLMMRDLSYMMNNKKRYLFQRYGKEVCSLGMANKKKFFFQ
jgi:hypothetical protein